MVLAFRLLALCCGALIVSGVAGALSVHSRPGAGVTTATVPATTTTTTAVTAPATSAPSGPPADSPVSAALAGGLIQPADMGGYYHSAPGVLSGLLDGNPCLAGFEPGAAQTGRAAEGLETGDLYAVPQIAEVVTSYPRSAAGSAYGAATAAMEGCRAFQFRFDGTPEAAAPAPEPLQTSAQAGQAWSVGFRYDGTAFDLQVGVVEQGPEVFFVGWVESVAVPPAEQIMGTFPSTVAVAVGDEA